MKYALAVEVKCVEVPDNDPSEMRPGDDPMKAMVGVMTGALGRVVVPYAQPAGFEFRTSTEIRVPNFSALAQIIGRFDELVTDIEHEKLHA